MTEQWTPDDRRVIVHTCDDDRFVRLQVTDHDIDFVAQELRRHDLNRFSDASACKENWESDVPQWIKKLLRDQARFLICAIVARDKQ